MQTVQQLACHQPPRGRSEHLQESGSGFSPVLERVRRGFTGEYGRKDKTMSPNWSVLGLGGQSRSGIAQQTRWHGRWELGEEISSEWLAGVAGVCPGICSSAFFSFVWREETGLPHYERMTSRSNLEQFPL